MYPESIDMLHSQNKSNLTYANSFLYFAQSALPYRLALGQRINVAGQHLLWYHENLLGDMKSLVELCAVLKKKMH